MDNKMDEQSNPFTIGASVKVKQGILDPDNEAFSIGGWQGRIVGIRDGENEPTVIEIEWDSITLQQMPKHVIEACEDEGLDWTMMGLYPEELDVTEARDREDMVKTVRKALENEHLAGYSCLGDQGKRIAAILQGVPPHDEMGALKRWGSYLQQHLSFPFDAEVEDWQERGPLRTGDRVKVKDISLIDDMYGVIVDLRRGREKFECPLCELTARDSTSANAQLMKDYRVWFANH